jgi:hypothetical protein
MLQHEDVLTVKIVNENVTTATKKILLGTKTNNPQGEEIYTCLLLPWGY